MSRSNPSVFSQQEALAHLESDNLPSKDDEEEKEKEETDEDYIPEKKSLRTKRKANLTRKPSSSESTGHGALLEAGGPGNRRGTIQPVECPTCHKTFLSKYYLKVHNRSVLLASEWGIGGGGRS